MLNPIMIEEVTEALAGAPTNKSLSSEGLPSEVYTKYENVLLPSLLQVLHEVANTGKLLTSMQEAIIVLPKPGIDLSLDSYSPIFFLPNRYKVIGKLIHGDQSGFIPSR